MERNSIMGSMVLCGIVLFTGHGILAQDGVLDGTFGTNGVVMLDHPYGVNSALYTIMDDQQRAWVVARNEFNLIEIARYHEDGTLDATFNGDGTFAFVSDTDIYVHALAVQADGKLLITGNLRWQENATLDDIFVVRLLADGGLDPSFGNAGMVRVDIAQNDYPVDIEVLDDGRILLSASALVIMGWAGPVAGDAALMRFEANGSLDPSFGVAGMVVTDLTPTGPDVDRGGPIAVQPDGKILMAGSNGSWLAALRYTADGSLDNDFWNGGISVVPVYVLPGALLLRSDGDFLVSGGYNGEFEHYWTLSRFTSFGVLDPTFANNGTYQSTGSPYYGPGFSLQAEQDDGKILCSGAWRDGSTPDGPSLSAVMRFTEQGEPDPSFGSEAMALWGIGDCSSSHHHLYRYPSGRITVIGTFNDQVDTNMVYIARYLNESDVSTADLDAIERAGPKIYPDPATGDRITLMYSLLSPDRVRKRLIDAEGRFVAALGKEEMRAAGYQEQLVDLPGDLAPGMYSIRLETSAGSQLVRFIKLDE